MTLNILQELDQRSDKWFEARRGIVTASVVGSLIASRSLTALEFTCPDCKAATNAPCVSKRDGAPNASLHPARTAVAKSDTSPPILEVADTDVSRGITATLAAERITDHTDPSYVSADMWRGIEDEPRAVEVYSEHFAPVETVGFMVEDKWGFKIGYSPDGLVGDDGLIEVKSRRQKGQLLTVIGDEVPAYNMAQLQCGLLVSGRKWIDYVSYCGGMRLWTKRVYPDDRWFVAILDAVAAFETNAAEMVATYEAATAFLPMTERFDLEIAI